MSKTDYSNGLYVRGKKSNRYELGDLSYALQFNFAFVCNYRDYELRFKPKNAVYWDYFQIYRHPDPLQRAHCYSDRHYYKYLRKIK